MSKKWKVFNLKNVESQNAEYVNKGNSVKTSKK